MVLFACLTGYLPFHAKEKKQLSEKILAGVYKPPATMSIEAVDLLSRMLTLDPAARISLEEVWCHPWVTRWGSWEAPGVGPGGLARGHADNATGALLPEESVLAALEAASLDPAAVRRALRHREWSSLTASYALAHEAWAEACARDKLAGTTSGKTAAAAAAAAAAQAAPLASVWQWDFSSLVRPTIAGSSCAAATGNSSCAATSTSTACQQQQQQQQQQRSPVRPRTGVSGGSPTRFQQEALAVAGCAATSQHFALCRPPSDKQVRAEAAAGVHAADMPSAAGITNAAGAATDAFVIRAVHASPDGSPASSAASGGGVLLDLEAGLLDSACKEPARRWQQAAALG